MTGKNYLLIRETCQLKNGVTGQDTDLFIFIFGNMTYLSRKSGSVKISLNAHTNTAHHHHITQCHDDFHFLYI